MARLVNSQRHFISRLS